jgi:hypothetical protein
MDANMMQISLQKDAQTSERIAELMAAILTQAFRLTADLVQP